MQILVEARFLTGNKLGEKSYFYLVDETLYWTIEKVFNQCKDMDDEDDLEITWPAFRIESDSHWNYRDSKVIFISAKVFQSSESKTTLTKLTKVTFASYTFLPKVTYGQRKKTWPALVKLTMDSLGLTVGEVLGSNANSDLKISVNGSLANNKISSSLKVNDLANDSVKFYSCAGVECESVAENTKEKKNSNMFEQLIGDMSCGPAKDVKMSIFGPAFKKTGSGNKTEWVAYHAGRWTDVTGMVFDDMDCAFKMPVSASDVDEGDFILHNNNWVRVVSILDDEKLLVEKIGLGEETTLIPVVNMFGFDFYVKLMTFTGDGGSFLGASKDNPFGMLPLMAMMNSSKSESNDSFMQAMMMAQMFSGGMFNAPKVKE